MFLKIGVVFPPKWMVQKMENPIFKWMIWIWGYHYFWKHPNGSEWNNQNPPKTLDGMTVIIINISTLFGLENRFVSELISTFKKSVFILYQQVCFIYRFYINSTQLPSDNASPPTLFRCSKGVKAASTCGSTYKNHPKFQKHGKIWNLFLQISFKPYGTCVC